MLNQSNYNFNRVLTYLDQGGNNIWWSANNISKTTPKAELVITGQGIDSDCIEEDCIPICSVINEIQEETIESVNKPQQLIYPTFIIEPNTLTIRLNNLQLINSPNYIEDGCIDSTCVEEFGIWTKALRSKTKIVIEGETYYFIKANPDSYNYNYLYSISLIHEETGEEIIVVKDKGILSNIITEAITIPPQFNVAIIITKFTVEEVITTYKFVNSPLYLRSNWATNLPWQINSNNIEEVLFSIIYLLYTDLEIQDKDKLILYKDSPQQILINILLDTITNITTTNSLSHSYIKTTTNIVEHNKLVTDSSEELLLINPAIYATTNYKPEQDSNTIYFLLLIVLSQTNNISLIQTYIDKVITLETTTLKEAVLKLIALVQTYKITTNIYHLSIATSTLEQINKRYKLEDDSYIESLENPTVTVESNIYGDLLNYYVYNKECLKTKYLLEQITYTTNINLYLTNSPLLLTQNPLFLLILNLLNLNIKSNTNSSSLVLDMLKLPISKQYLSNNILNNIDLFKEEVFNTFKATLPTDFSWLSATTPIQDTIITSITKPLIDLYIHSNYIKQEIILKDALTTNYSNNIITNRDELLPKTLTTDISDIRSSLWPGNYSNSIDLEIEGYYDETTIEFTNNVKSLGIQTNLISGVNLPTINNFNLCVDIVEKNDYRCQVDINGQLILLSNGECDLAPPTLDILVQENTYPITLESSITDFILL